MAIQFLRCNETSFNRNKSKILLDGQPLFNKDSATLYIGDGSTVLNDLPSLKFEKPNVGTITQPSLSLRLSPSSSSGEIGSAWPTISRSLTFSTGKYTYGPTPTGVTFIDSPVYSPASISGVFGDSAVAMTVTQSYTAGNYANTDRGTASTQRIEAGTAESVATFTGTAQYRAFFGSSTSTDIDALLASLKSVTSNTAGFSTSLITSTPSNATLPIVAGSYLYIISHYSVDTSKIKDDNTGFEVAFESLDTKTFTNSYNAKYSVYIYRSLNTFNAGSITLRLR